MHERKSVNERTKDRENERKRMADKKPRPKKGKRGRIRVSQLKE